MHIGSAIDINMFNPFTGSVSRKDFADVMRRVKDAQKTFKESGFGFAVEGDIDSGSMKIITDAKMTDDAMSSLFAELGSLTASLGGSASQRNANLRTRHYDNVSARHLARMKAQGLGKALDYDYNAEDKSLDMMYEVGTNTGVRAAISRTASRSAAAAQQKLLENTPGTAQFAAKVQARLNRRSQVRKDELAWAKGNKGDPIAKRILNANKSKGRKMLEGAMRNIKAAAGKAVLNLIKNGINQMVKFLASLPAIAEDTRKLSLKGVFYNIDKFTMRQYAAMANVMQPGDNGKMFQEAQAVIHSKLGDILRGDLNGVLNEIAAISSQVGGGSIADATSYYLGLASNPDAFMRAVLNDVMKFSFQGRAIGVNRELNPNEAFSRNVLTLSKLGLEDLAVNLFRVWQNDTTSAKGDVMNEVLDRGDWVQLIYEKIMHSPESSIDVMGGVTHDRSEQVADAFRDLAQKFNAVKGGILHDILSSLEWLSNFLEWALKGLLRGLNKTSAFEGVFDEMLIRAELDLAAKNALLEESLKNQQQVMATTIVDIRRQYGMEDHSTREAALENYGRGHGNLPIEYVELERYYQELLNALAQFDADVRAGKKEVKDVTPEAIAKAVSDWMHTASGNRNQILSSLVNDAGINFNRIPYARRRIVNEYIPDVEAVIERQTAIVNNILLSERERTLARQRRDELRKKLRYYNEQLIVLDSIETELNDVSGDERNERLIRLANSVNARESGERINILALGMDTLYRQLGSTLTNALRENRAEFHGIIRMEGTESRITVDITDRLTGTVERHTSRAFRTPTIRSDHDATFINNIIPVLENQTRTQPISSENLPGYDYSHRTNW